MTHLLAISNFFRNSNYIEAGVWASIAVLILIFGSKWRIGRRNRLIVAITLLAFGGSDWVEAGTGAWWDPWWLLVWKGVCVIVLLVGSLRFLRQKKMGPRDIVAQRTASADCTNVADQKQ